MHIIIATGGSVHSEIAMHMAGMLAAATESQVTLMTVAFSELRREHAEQISMQAAANLRELVGEVQTRVAVGRAAEQIVREIQLGDYDLLVIGERPGQRLIHRILTNTVERLTELAPCPVLVAREAGLPLRMLICESGRQPLVVERMARSLGPLMSLCKEATLLHVMSQMAAAPKLSGWELHATAQEHISRRTPEGTILQQGLDVLEDAGIKAQPVMRYGWVVDEIISETQANYYDLAVIGAFRASGWQRLMLSDLARAILAGTSQPLLVV